MESFKTYISEAAGGKGLDLKTFNYWSYTKTDDQYTNKQQRLKNFIAKIEGKKGDWAPIYANKERQGPFKKTFMTKGKGDVTLHPEFADVVRKAFENGSQSALEKVFKGYLDDSNHNLVPLEYKENRKLVPLADLIKRTKAGELNIKDWTVNFGSLLKTDWDFGGSMAKSSVEVTTDTGGKMPAQGPFDSTKFEANICYGCTRLWAEKNNKWGIKPLDGNKGTSHHRAFNILNEKKAYNGKSFDISKDINWNQAACQAGYDLAKKLGLAEVSYIPDATFGLDSVYVKYGASSKIMKTDIMIGKKRISVKKMSAAQLATPTAGEAAAIFHYACEKTPHPKFNADAVSALMYKVLSPRGFASSRMKFGKDLAAKDFDKFMTNVLFGRVDLKELKKGNDNLMNAISPELQATIASQVDSREREFRAGLRDSTVEAWVLRGDNFKQYATSKTVHDMVFNFLKDKTDMYSGRERLEKSHSKQGGLPKKAYIKFFAEAPKKLKDKLIASAKNPIIEAQKETIKAVWLMPMPEINESIMDYLDEPALHEYLMWEMATGYHKFNDSTATADYVLGWEKDGSGDIHKIGGPHGAYAKKLTKCVSMMVADRGRPIDPIPGFGKVKKGALRMNITKACYMSEEVFRENKEVFGHDYMNLSKEEEQWCEDFGEAYADEYTKRYLNEHTEEELLEGFLGDLGKGLSNMGKKAVQWGKDLLADFAAMIKKALAWLAAGVARLASIVGKAFNDGALTAMQLFNIGQHVSIVYT